MYNDFDTRMKSYEQDTVFGSDLPVIVRVDGKSFHSYVKQCGFKKPYDVDLHNAMTNATTEVIKDTDAVAAYHQSDEVTFLFYNNRPQSQIYFDGRKAKLESVLASMFTHYFGHFSPGSRPAFFDARCYQVPNLIEAANVFTWRYLDCVRNSISALAHTHFSTKELHGRSQSDMLEMLEDVDPWEKYPGLYKFGTFIRKGCQGWMKGFSQLPINERIEYLLGIYV